MATVGKRRQSNQTSNIMDREQLTQLTENEKINLILSLTARIVELEAQLKNRP